MKNGSSSKKVTIAVVGALVVCLGFGAGDNAEAGTVDTDCAMALLYPACGFCVTRCVYAIIADIWMNEDWNFRF
jgi:hypothetical protein